MDKLQFLVRAPRYPVIVVVEDRVFASNSRKQLIRLFGENFSETVRLLDSTWEWFVYRPSLSAFSPHFPFRQPPSKLEIIEVVNRRANRLDNGVLCRTTSLSTRSRSQVFQELIAILTAR